MDKKLRDNLIAHINNVTRAWEAARKPKTKTTPRAQRLFNLIKGNFGCYERSVIKLIGELTGMSFDDLVRTQGDSDYPNYLALIVDASPGIYGIVGEPVIMSTDNEDDAVYITLNDEWCVDQDFVNANLKPATLAQIKRLNDFQLEKVYQQNPVAFVQVPRATRARRKK